MGSAFYLVNQIARIFPSFGYGASPVISVPRVDDMSTAAFLGNSTADTDDSAPTYVAPATEFFITTVQGDTRITTFAKTVLSYAIDQEKLEVDLKKFACIIEFWKQFFRPQAGQGFKGLPQLTDASQTIQAGPNGAPLTLPMMDALVMLVTEAMGEMDSKFILMHTTAWLKYVSLIRAAGTDLQYKTVKGMMYAHHNGSAIMISDYIPTDETLGAGTDLTSIYCCTLGYQNGGLFAAYPPGVGTDGWVIEKAQDEARKDVCVYRVKLYTTLVLTQIKGLARIEGLDVEL